jgi:hypothetical protein
MRSDLVNSRQKSIIAGVCKELGVRNPINGTETVGQASRTLKELRKELRRQNGNKR